MAARYEIKNSRLKERRRRGDGNIGKNQTERNLERETARAERKSGRENLLQSLAEVDRNVLLLAT